jgi:hypothetical protein
VTGAWTAGTALAGGEGANGAPAVRILNAIGIASFPASLAAFRAISGQLQPAPCQKPPEGTAQQIPSNYSYGRLATNGLTILSNGQLALRE